MCSPLYKASLYKLRFVNSPLVALSNDRAYLRSLDHGLFLKKETQKLYFGHDEHICFLHSPRCALARENPRGKCYLQIKSARVCINVDNLTCKI